MRSLFSNPVSKCLTAAGMALFLAGCIAGSNVDMLSHYIKTIRQPASEIERLKLNFDQNPYENSQVLGEAFLRLMYAKHPVLGQEVCELPDIRDGIAPLEATALEKMYDIVKPLHLPNDILNHPEPVIHRIKIEWSGREADWSGKIVYGANFPKHTVHSVTPIDFETGDAVDKRLLTEKNFLSWHSKIGSQDRGDGVAVDLEYPIHKTVMIELSRQDGIAFFKMSDLLMNGRLEFGKDFSFDGQLRVIYLDAPKSIAEIDNLTKTAIIRQVLRMGKGEKYSPSLEALFWSIHDGSFTNETLAGHSDAIEMTKEIWGQMDGPRWKDYDSVVKRLSDKYLLHYYSQKKIDYEYYIGSRITAKTVFSKGWANCKDGARWFQVPMRAAKHKTFLLWVNGKTVHGHVILAFDDNGEIYVFDHSIGGTKLLGPFESRYKIPYDIIKEIN